MSKKGKPIIMDDPQWKEILLAWVSVAFIAPWQGWLLKSLPFLQWRNFTFAKGVASTF